MYFPANHKQTEVSIPYCVHLQCFSVRHIIYFSSRHDTHTFIALTCTIMMYYKCGEVPNGGGREHLALEEIEGDEEEENEPL